MIKQVKDERFSILKYHLQLKAIAAKIRKKYKQKYFSSNSLLQVSQINELLHK
jgi:hypothetical protein